MQIKPTSLSSKIVSIVAAINGLGTLLLGVFWVLIIEISEPSPSEMKVDLATIAAQRDREQLTVFLLVVIYLIIYFVVLVFWVQGKRLWSSVFLSLTALHLVSLYYWFVYFWGYLPTVLFIALALDLVILVTVIVDQMHSKVNAKVLTG